MIKYRYNLATDPEPPTVKRIQTNGFGLWHWSVVWRRVPCRKSKYPASQDQWPMGRRSKVRRFRKTLRREKVSVPYICPRRSVFENSQEYEYYGHRHWYNTDRYRSWASGLRGATYAVDLDAFRRMRTMTRARTWRRNRRQK